MQRFNQQFVPIKEYDLSPAHQVLFHLHRLPLRTLLSIPNFLYLIFLSLKSIRKTFTSISGHHMTDGTKRSKRKKNRFVLNTFDNCLVKHFVQLIHS